MAITTDKLVAFLEQELAVDTTNIEDTTPLFSAGIVDSFAIISLMTYLETESGISIDPVDVTLENMDSIQRIMNFVSRVNA